MKRKGFLALLCAASFLGIFIGFWLYSGGRSLAETVGFHLSGLTAGLFLGLLLPLIYIGLPATLLLKWVGQNKRSVFRVLLMFSLMLLTGCAIAEIRVLKDEAAFATEIKGRTIIYNRARVWPNQSSMLVFVPGQGIHATD